MRDALIILAVCLAAVAGGAWLLFAGNAPAIVSPQDVAFTVIDRGQDSVSITKRVNYRIKSSEEFAELWETLHGVTDSLPPALDLEKNDVLAIFDGSHSTGGYDVRVTAVTDSGGLSRLVVIDHIEPGDTCLVTQAFTSPYELILVPKSDAALAREDATIVNECP